MFLDDFLVRAMLGGVGIAAIAGPLGCIVVWRRLAYFGDTLAHAAILGVVFSVVSGFNLTLAVFVVAALVALALWFMQRRSSVPADALLGLLAHGTLALGLVGLSLVSTRNVDVMALLFGDILSISKFDIGVVAVSAAVMLLVLAVLWRSLFAATVSAELAEAEGIRLWVVELGFMLLIAALVALAIKLVGALLITALLLIPAASARRFASSPEHMALLAVLMGCVAVLGGLTFSLYADTPAGPSIVVLASVIFVLVQLIPRRAF